eukprot:CAMPEP_0115036830 /NCGR_PEP_ID=MMETSP0216-20121206/42388_1 /TAXON_ID=223996 /ORGANISM="Protocruzia adherens, Strain Boccale" /LENGTH=220 /DNA_ID=CAMNT_0002416797 /DNA_START=98 /DNA_END=760 /DNA_ORIENTATION=+
MKLFLITLTLLLTTTFAVRTHFTQHTLSTDVKPSEDIPNKDILFSHQSKFAQTHIKRSSSFSSTSTDSNAKAVKKVALSSNIAQRHENVFEGSQMQSVFTDAPTKPVENTTFSSQLFKELFQDLDFDADKDEGEGEFVGDDDNDEAQSDEGRGEFGGDNDYDEAESESTAPASATTADETQAQVASAPVAETDRDEKDAAMLNRYSGFGLIFALFIGVIA